MKTIPLLPEVATFLDRRQGLRIADVRVEIKALIEVENPSTGAPLAQVAAAGASHVDQAVDAARAALSGPWGTRTPHDRGQLPWRLADAIEDRKATFGQLDAPDNGKRFAAARVGPGMKDAAHDLGPVISAPQMKKVLGYVDSGVADGAQAVAGGARQGETGYFVQPTVLAGVRDEMRIAREEIFGPVLCVLPFDAEDEVLTRANDTVCGLAAGCWTQDIGRANLMAAGLRAGTIWTNCWGRYRRGLALRRHGPERLWARGGARCAGALYLDQECLAGVTDA